MQLIVGGCLELPAVGGSAGINAGGYVVPLLGNASFYLIHPCVYWI